MTREENIRAILECNFSGTKEELIDIAVKSIMALSQEPTVTSTDKPMTMVYPTIVCDDAINRQAVKDILNNSYSLTDAEHRVEQLPSVTPIIPDNATNGEVFGKIMDYMFMDDAYISTDKNGYLHLRGVKDDWWNALYQKGGKK